MRSVVFGLMCVLGLGTAVALAGECGSCSDGGSKVVLAADAAPSTQPAPVNAKCPVEGGAVKANCAVEHDGKTVGFCCKGCIKKFQENPDKYVGNLKAAE